MYIWYLSLKKIINFIFRDAKYTNNNNNNNNNNNGDKQQTVKTEKNIKTIKSFSFFRNMHPDFCHILKFTQKTLVV